MRENVQICMHYIRKITDFVPDVALVLGSGLGKYAQQLDEVICSIPYNRIPGFPVSTVSGHAGRYVMGYKQGVAVVIMDGRVHYYEGYTPEEIVLPIRVLRAMGAKIVLLSNAAGGVNTDYHPGKMVVIRDHISMFVPNPLRGENDPDEGERFPDMSKVYDPELRRILMESAARQKIVVNEGIYCQLSGPSYETPAEIRIIKELGADLVGMSTVMEAIAARHAGMKVCGISLVTNMAAGISDVPLNHEEVKLAGKQSAESFSKWVTDALPAMKQYLETMN